MCVISMVMDYYKPMFPGPKQQFGWAITYPPADEVERLRKLIDEFKGAVDAAKKVDALTKQPDCIDPEKAKLLARVAKLEAALAKANKRKARKRRTGRTRRTTP